MKRYSGAAAIAAAAILVRIVLDPLLEGVQFITFFPAAALAGYLYGRRAGILAVLLCGFAGWYFFVEPHGSFLIRNAPQAVTLFLYFTIASGLAVGSDVIRQGAEREHLAKLALEEQRDVAEEVKQRFRRSEARLLLAQRAARAVAWEWDFETNSIRWSDLKTLHELAGDDLDWVIDFAQWCSRIHPDDLEGHLQEAAAAVEAGRGILECRIIKDGEVRWIEATGEVVERGEDGRPLKMTGITLDATERRLAQQHQQLLINELNHRVKNTLAVVQSLARQTFKAAAATEARAAFEGRLQSLARAHDALTRRNWDGVTLAEVVDAATSPFQSDANGFAVNGPELQIRSEPAISLAMAFHELATNAAKYGALSVPGGAVEVSWSIDEHAAEPLLKMRWRESGGPAIAPPVQRGFGSRLLERGLATELGGRVEFLFNPGGVSCEIDAPFSQLVRSDKTTFASSIGEVGAL
jgi:two-component sensor histidine kinase/PAS domain-containing protein